MRTTRITITRITKTAPLDDLNRELQVLGAALGLFAPRDRDKSRFRIFIFLLRAIKQGRTGLTSDELAMHLGLTRATVIHHLQALMDAGMVEHLHGEYGICVESLEDLVGKIREDVNKTFDDLAVLAQRCDQGLGL